MGETILFCLVFSSQVLLISCLYARRVISRSRYVLEHFPPSTHPKLYPQPLEYYQRRLSQFARLNGALVIAGLLVAVGLILATAVGEWGRGIASPGRSRQWDAVIVAPFFIVQVFASVYLDLASLKHHRAMAKAAPPRVRTTELRRRRLFDYVSPGMLMVAALTYVAFIAFVLYYRRFDFPWFTAAGNIAAVSALMVLFSAVVAMSVLAPRPDPYQAQKDRQRWIELVVKQALAACIGFPVLITANLVAKLFDSGRLDPVITSLFCQGVAVTLLWPFYHHRVEAVDFEVYREDTPTRGA
jgi:MFS family permease